MSVAAKLGEEQSFADLLNGVMDPHMLVRFRRFRASSMLDIGCREGKTLVYCHYTLGVTHLEGIECESKAVIDKEVRTRYHKPRAGRSCASIEEYWSLIIPSSSDIISKAKSRSELQQLLKIKFGSFAELYQPELPHYDIIILSHMLHYQTDRNAQRVLEMVAKCSHPGTLIYLSVKDAFQVCPIPKHRLLELCRHFAKEQHLVEHPGPYSDTQGQSFIFTNL